MSVKTAFPPGDIHAHGAGQELFSFFPRQGQVIVPVYKLDSVTNDQNNSRLKGSSINSINLSISASKFSFHRKHGLIKPLYEPHTHKYLTVVWI